METLKFKNLTVQGKLNYIEKTVLNKVEPDVDKSVLVEMIKFLSSYVPERDC